MHEESINPYVELGEDYFWSSAVAKKNMFDISNLFDPKWKIQKTDKVATFGSCFAQHIGKALINRGFNLMNEEPGPKGASEELLKKYNYNIFSCRTGNIYTTQLLLQWVSWALGTSEVPKEVWQKNGRFYDPFRPNIEPNGFDSPEELYRSRSKTISAFRKIVEECNIFVFTLGLTESWVNKEFKYEYAACPGTLAGTYDESAHTFINQDYLQVRKSLLDSMNLCRKTNPKIRFLLTVSPVPLTATMSGNHVLVATTESKSILRAVAGNLKSKFDFVDYFSSYEIITSTAYRSVFFEPNLRSVNLNGVNFVMDNFFNSYAKKFSALQKGDSITKSKIIETAKNKSSPIALEEKNSVVCEEELLEAFNYPKSK